MQLACRGIAGPSHEFEPIHVQAREASLRNDAGCCLKHSQSQQQAPDQPLEVGFARFDHLLGAWVEPETLEPLAS
jgi:hypothetical protein